MTLSFVCFCGKQPHYNAGDANRRIKAKVSVDTTEEVVQGVKKKRVILKEIYLVKFMREGQKTDVSKLETMDG